MHTHKRFLLNSGTQLLLPLLLSATSLLLANCNKSGDNKPTPQPVGEVEQWLTSSNQSKLLEKQATLLAFASTDGNRQSISVDEATTYQTMSGFGYTLTGGSALLIKNMSSAQRAKLLSELFGNGTASIGVSYLRISLGASDLSPKVFSYNDLPSGATDPTLSQFTLADDTLALIPVLQEILAINPAIKIMASPWSAPTWMKSNNSSVGGSLLPQFYNAYAQYFVKYIKAMKDKGISIDAVTVQNEPQHGGNNPSMVMSAAEQTNFVKNNLGPAIRDASLTTNIIIWDHNCDNPQYPISVLSDATARSFIKGSAFHLYAGDITAMSSVHNAYPDKDLYFTEQWTGANGSFSGDFQWHMKNVVIGSVRNWAKVALEWNLANDPQYGPHTPGGCTECKGAITINGSDYVRNVSYYIIAQAAKFVPAGSVVIGSSGLATTPYAAFKTPAGKKILIVMNDGSQPLRFNIKYNNKYAAAELAAGTAATYVW